MKHLIPVLGLACLTLQGLPAQEAEVSPDAESSAPATSVLDEPVIPQAYPDARYQTTWSSNPFLRKTVTPVGPKIDWSQDWALAGMYRSESGKITISLQNKQTAEFKRVTSEDDANSEFRLIKANFNRNRNEASADIARGSETATVKYDDNLTSRPVTVTNTLKTPAGAQPGAPGTNPNMRPGQPGAQVTNPNLRTQPGQPPQAVNVTPPGGGQALPGAAVPGAQQSPVAPPTISRRRQLIPAPVVPPPQ